MSLRDRCEAWLGNGGFVAVPWFLNSLTTFVESEIARCPDCDGTGCDWRIDTRHPDEPCPHCRGTGKREELPCGTGAELLGEGS